MRYTPVETHEFKEAFVDGRTAGFVVCVDLPGQGRQFAEIYGTPNAYCIFEEQSEAELHRDFASEKLSEGTNWDVLRVTANDIRDYQTLQGRKIVRLIDRATRITESLRIGDMPLWARTRSPFPLPTLCNDRYKPGQRMAKIPFWG